MSNTTIPIRDALDDKVNRLFAGKVVRKDLVRKVKVGTNVPVFVLEFLDTPGDEVTPRSNEVGDDDKGNRGGDFSHESSIAALSRPGARARFRSRTSVSP